LTNNFKALENAGKQTKYLKVLEKSLNLNLHYVEILHLITILKQTLVFISPVLAFSTLAHLTNATDNETFHVSLWLRNKLMTAICHACIITVLMSAVQHMSLSHCSLNFEAPHLYGFLSVILVLESCKFRSLKVIENSPNFVL